MWALTCASPAALAAVPNVLPLHSDTPTLVPKAPSIARLATPVEGAAALSARLSDVAQHAGLRHSALGIAVVRLDTGATVFALHPERSLVPASNVKLVTTLAALDALSPDFQFVTEIYGALDANGVVNGDLTVKGYGDPYLTPERLASLATRLKMRGVDRVTGRLRIDDTFFAAKDRMANGWQEDRSSRAYMAPMGAVSVGFNAIMVHVLPSLLPGANAQVRIEPEQRYLRRVEGTIGTVDGLPSRTRVEVSGRTLAVSGYVARELGPHAFWRRIEDPPAFAGEVFKSALEAAHVQVDGEVQVAAVEPATTLLASATSPRLGELVVPLNKFSNNFMAGQLALALGAARFGAPATWDKAHRALETFLSERVHVAKGQYQLGNASGLHGVNHMRASQLVQLLAFARAQPRYNVEFENALPTAGGIGTLADRMHGSPASAVVRAKTGTLLKASSLSGYATTKDGVPLAFSLLCNDYRHIEDVWAAQDWFAATLAAASLKAPDREAAAR